MRKSRPSLKQVQTPPQADDFSQEKPIISLADPSSFKLDEDAGPIALPAPAASIAPTPRSNQTSKTSSTPRASFHARATTTWIVTSEGAIVRKSAVELSGELLRGHAGSRRHAPRSLLRLLGNFARLTSTPRPSSISTPSTSSPRSPSCARPRSSKRSITARCYSAPTPPPTHCARCSLPRSRPRAPRLELKPAPTARLHPATTRALCPTS